MATIFNVNGTHVKYVKALLKTKDVVVIHGDGHMFASSNGENQEIIDENGKRVLVEGAISGSNHHRQFNAGYDTEEATAKAKYRAVYRKGDKAPETLEDIEKAFIEQYNVDLSEKLTARVEAPSNILKLDAEEKQDVKEEKKAGRPAKTT